MIRKGMNFGYSDNYMSIKPSNELNQIVRYCEIQVKVLLSLAPAMCVKKLSFLQVNESWVGFY